MGEPVFEHGAERLLELGKRGQVPFFFARGRLNHSQPKEEIEKMRCAIKRSGPYGSERWVKNAVAELGLENTPRKRGRPRKGT